MRIKRSPFKPRAKAGVYRIENKTEAEATLYIYDEIGWFGVEAEQFVKDLNTIKAQTIHIRFNTPGGSVFDGTSMFNAIKQHKSHTITHVDGLAASISSVIALAADEVHMAENAFFMIHEPWSIVIGDAETMRDEADLLDKISGTIAKTYMSKTGKDEKEIKTLMAAETWMTADEAKELGFVDVIEEDEKDEKAKACLFDLSVFANVPDQLKSQDIKKDLNARDLEKSLRDAGYSRNQAKEIVAKVFQDVRDAQTDPVNQDVREAQNDDEDHLRDADHAETKEGDSDAEEDKHRASNVLKNPKFLAL